MKKGRGGEVKVMGNEEIGKDRDKRKKVGWKRWEYEGYQLSWLVYYNYNINLYEYILFIYIFILLWKITNG